MVASSAVSPGSDKSSTRETSKLTREDLLEIFQEAVVRLQKAGFDMRVFPMYSQGETWVEFRLAGVDIVEKKLRIIEHEETTAAPDHTGSVH